MKIFIHIAFFLITVSFTVINAQTTIMSQDFENGGAIPTGWTQSQVTGSVNWSFTAGAYSGAISSAHGGSYNARFFDGTWSSYTTKLITPVIDFTGYTTSPTLTFWHGQQVWGSDQGVLKVYYKTSAGGSWTLITTYSSSVSSWTQRTISLPNVNSTYYIAFEGITNYDKGIVVDDMTITGTASCTPPVTQATSFTSSSVASTTATIGWTRGSGTGGVVVVARAAGAVNADVSSGNTYTASAVYGSGTQVGTGNYVVYSGTGTSVNLTGLSISTAYYFAVYEYNSSGTCYNTTELTGNFTTTSCTSPVTQASSFTSSSVGSSTLTGSWVRGSGDAGVVVLVKASSAVNSDPVSGTNYTASTVFGSGTEVGTGIFVVYKGTGTSVGITGLSPNTSYYFGVYEYNSSGTCFNSSELTGNVLTIDGPATVGFFISGNVVNNGTLDQTNETNYFTMNGTTKSITGTGIYTDAKLYSNGTITFNGTISSGKFTKTYVETAKTFTISSGKTYVNGTFTNYGTTTLSATSTFQNSGDWTNNGTVSAAATSLAEFNGTSAQTINGSTTTSFADAKINNSSTGVTLGINTTVTGGLTLTSGLLKTASYTLSLGTSSSNATVTGGSASSYIVAYDNSGTIGYVKSFVNSNTSYSFPIGDLTRYTPLTYTQTSATLSSAYLTVYTKAVKVTGLNSSLTNYVNRYWDVTPSGITSPTYTIAYTYNDADIVGSETNFKPIKLSSGTWYKPTGCSFLTGTAQGTSSLNAGTNTLTWSSLTTFSLFGGAGDQTVALPIELLSFDAKKYQNNVKVNWKTASEINNDYFTVERSSDGENFDSVSEVDGAGNSTHTISYFLIDTDYKNGINYYRLKQTDYNGSETFSQIVAVDMTKIVGDKVMTVNSIGQEVNESYSGIVFDIYSDGSSVKRIQ